MTDFLELLNLYYLCDATALLRPMAGGEVLACMDTYEAVKAWFAPFDLAPSGTLARFEQMSEGYLGFLAWQEANAELVTEMRQTATAQAAGLLPAMIR